MGIKNMLIFNLIVVLVLMGSCFNLVNAESNQVFYPINFLEERVGIYQQHYVDQDTSTYQVAYKIYKKLEKSDWEIIGPMYEEKIDEDKIIFIHFSKKIKARNLNSEHQKIIHELNKIAEITKIDSIYICKTIKPEKGIGKKNLLQISTENQKVNRCILQVITEEHNSKETNSLVNQTVNILHKRIENIVDSVPYTIPIIRKGIDEIIVDLPSNLKLNENINLIFSKGGFSFRYKEGLLLNQKHLKIKSLKTNYHKKKNEYSIIISFMENDIIKKFKETKKEESLNFYLGDRLLTSFDVTKFINNDYKLTVKGINKKSEADVYKSIIKTKSTPCPIKILDYKTKTVEFLHKESEK